MGIDSLPLIVLHLPSQFPETAELFLRPEEIQHLHFHFFSVQILIEIIDKCLHADRLSVAHGGLAADIGQAVV